MILKNRLYAVVLLAVLLFSARQPIQPAPATQQADEATMAVVDMC